jgi:aspartate racemase
MALTEGTATRPRHIGILAHSGDGAALCFLTAVREGAARMGPHDHPPITLSILPMAACMDAWARTDLVFLRAELMRTAKTLAHAGCEFFVCPDNTAHQALEHSGAPFPIPGLHIAEAVTAKAAEDGRRRLGVLGTKWLMEGPVYRDACARRGIEMKIPGEKRRTYIQQAIFEELCQGKVLDATRRTFVDVIGELQAEGCDAVVLGCTEIPLLIDDSCSPLPTLPSTQLLAKAAVDAALDASITPSWRGGPPAR